MSESEHVRWGTMTGLDPELVRQLAECKRAREERETEAIDLDALSKSRTRRGYSQATTPQSGRDSARS